MYARDENKIYKNNQVISLAKKEAKLFKIFLQNQNNIVTKEQILSFVYGDEMVLDSSLRSLVRRLGRNLPVGKIESVSMVGYKFYID